METKVLEIDKIQAVRLVDTPDVFVERIKKAGQPQPLLLNEALEVIDGEKQLIAMEWLGYTEAEVVIASGYADALAFIDKNRDGEPVSRQRIVEMYHMLRPMMFARRGGKKRPNAGRNGRMLAATSFGLRGEGELQRLLTSYTKIQGLPEREQQQYLDRLYDENVSVYTVYHELSGYPYSLKGEIKSKQEQRNVLNGVVTQFGAVVTALNTLQEPIKVPATELEPIIDALVKRRGTLTTVINRLRFYAKEGTLT